MSTSIKANRLHPHHYPYMPPDYRHTDQHLKLVMTLIALWCTQQSRAPNIDRCVPEIWPWPWFLTWHRPLTLTLIKPGNSDVKTGFLAFDLRPMTLTCNITLAKVKVELHPKNQGQMSKANWFSRESADKRVNTQTDGQIERRTVPSTNYLPAKASRSIINTFLKNNNNFNMLCHI